MLQLPSYTLTQNAKSQRYNELKLFSLYHHLHILLLATKQEIVRCSKTKLDASSIPFPVTAAPSRLKPETYPVKQIIVLIQPSS